VTSELSAPNRPEFDTDDWDDQDLLTKDEARLRVEQGVRVAEEELAAARTSAPDRVASLETYLERARTELASITS
jgi:hypothetical protein